MVPHTEYNGLYINGEWVMPASGETEEVLNPATEEVIGLCPIGGAPEIEAALVSARDAFDKGPWPRLPMAERIKYMEAFLDYFEARADSIQALITAEVGAIQETVKTIQFDSPIEHCRYAIEEARQLQPKAVPLAALPFAVGGGQIVLDPVGVVSAITPYNTPFALNIGKVVPALLMGNTCVLKTSPFTPFEALLCGDAAQAIELPPGVLNIVTGGIEVATAMTADHRVDLVSFTGSDAIGAAIMAQGAPTLKRMMLELGGKSAAIVCDDVDVQRVAYGNFRAFTTNTGQGCGCLTRHLVHNSIRAEYVKALQAVAQAVKIGNPRDPETTLGPLISAQQRARVEHYVQLGLDGGGDLVLGGKRPEHLPRGYYYEPTVFDNIDNSSAIAQEEIFGPVAVVIGFDTDDEAIALANDSDFGLTGAVYSPNVVRAYELSIRMQTGGVWINGGSGKVLSSMPFGGCKRSGYGREYGDGWLKEYAQEKVLSFHLG